MVALVLIDGSDQGRAQRRNPVGGGMYQPKVTGKGTGILHLLPSGGVERRYQQWAFHGSILSLQHARHLLLSALWWVGA